MREYNIIRTNRKTTALHISRDLQLTVRAPLQVSDNDIEKFVAKNERWIQRTLDKIGRLPAVRQYDEQQIRVLRERAAAYIPTRVEYYSQIMGITPSGVRITGAKTRFGSCNGHGGLCFSLYLMQYAPECIDYVVVHELAHIIEHNHSAAFYKIVEKYLPDYRQLSYKLKYGECE